VDARNARPLAALAALLHLQIFGGVPATIADDFVLNLLVLLQIAETGALDRGNMHEHVWATACRLNEPVTFGRVEPLHLASRHVFLLSSPRGREFG
jgi:hypothetical protein